MSMKKFLLSAMVLLLPLVAMAQPASWTLLPANYPDETPVYVTVYVNGVKATGNDALQMAAFIDGDCRATALYMEQVMDPQTPGSFLDEMFVLRVQGDLSTEQGKTIKFRAYDGRFEYEFTTTAVKFTGETNFPSDPLVLNLDKVTGVSLTNPIVINQPETSFPYQVDMLQYVSFTYNEMTGAPYTPKGESSIFTEFSYFWSEESPNLYFEGNTMTVEIGAANEGEIPVSLSCGDNFNPEATLSTSTIVKVNIQAIPVTSITCDISDTIMYAYEDFTASIASHIKVTPNNASYATYHFECDTQGALAGNMFTAGGNYVLKIVSDDPDYTGAPATVNVTVYVRPTNIGYKQPEITVNYGANVYDAIAANQTVTWPTAEDPGQWGKSDVTYAFNQTGYVDNLGNAIQIGSVQVTVTLKDGITPSMAFMGNDSYMVTVNIISALEVTAEAPTIVPIYKKGVQAEAPVYVYVKNPGNEPFDASALTITFINRYEGKPYATQVGGAVKQDAKDGQGRDVYAFTIEPRYIGQPRFSVYYGNPNVPLYVSNITIQKEEELSKGWTWLSLATEGGAVATLLTKDDIVEIRSQQQLLVNDPKYGYVGGITYLTPNEAMYKVKTNKATTVNWGSTSMFGSDAGAEAIAGKNINKGYNWVNYPYEFDLEAGRIADFLGYEFIPADGDVIKLQNSFATYDGTKGTWTAEANFVLKEGQGFMYYSTVDGMKMLNFNPDFAPSNEPTNARALVPCQSFQYDVHAFADNMSMVAEIQGLENPEDYTLGAFVNGECRGRGTVAADGKMFVNAVGENGEVVTFKLVNNRTGEMMPIEGAVDFSQIKGSLRAPVKLAPEATAIKTIGTAEQSKDAYDLSGRRIMGSQRGISIERTADGKVRKVVKK